MIRKRFFVFSFLFLPLFLFAQHEQVILKARRSVPLRKFEISQSSAFDVVNGRFSAVLLSSNGYLFEIADIPAGSVHCGACLKQKQFRVILNQQTDNTIFSSSDKSKGVLKMKCLSGGKMALTYTGDIYSGKRKISVNAILIGEVAHSRHLKTNENEK